MTKVVSHEDLKELVVKKLCEESVRQEEAEIVADVLIHANLRGVDSHGVMKTEHYVKRIQGGGLNIDSNPQIEKSSDTTAVYNGDNGFGHVIAKHSMDLAIQMAKDHGIGVVGVKRSSHCGALSYFVKQALDEKLIGVAMTHTETAVIPFGAAEPYFGTNPIAFGFPTNNEEPIIFDFATSKVAFGKVLNAIDHGQQIPADWGVDEEGNQTTDPSKVSYLHPFGEAKGYGLGFIVEIFAGLLTGSAFGPHITKMYVDYSKALDIGHFFMVLDPAKFIAAEDFLNNLDCMIREIHSLKPSKGFTKVLVPGEPEVIQEKIRRVDGIPLPESVFRYLNQSVKLS
ncbi:ureidoglycolate dehydrogenase [Siminovitchia acidinfaciens]|uniref:Ureidoglycolate dehydrogenase n=1 Tax=Siminovitchia acidinfaciens TaxID=2321395 RepID=A0A429XSU5_9BACI|nr:ureidoglycolate dehydrogenase [Siminovitchia acidinfaciens]RST70304.1 ureidoglycolate dehydrogenase [Siminovitchia acidinfaciens]